MRELASGLGFPEGPVALDDGSVLVVEIAAGNLTRVDAKGVATVVAHCGGGPNGAALGPDGAVYVCNDGGLEFVTIEPQSTGPTDRQGTLGRRPDQDAAGGGMLDHPGQHPWIAPFDVLQC